MLRNLAAVLIGFALIYALKMLSLIGMLYLFKGQLNEDSLRVLFENAYGVLIAAGLLKTFLIYLTGGYLTGFLSTRGDELWNAKVLILLALLLMLKGTPFSITSLVIAASATYLGAYLQTLHGSTVQQQIVVESPSDR